MAATSKLVLDLGEIYPPSLRAPMAFRVNPYRRSVMKLLQSMRSKIALVVLVITTALAPAVCRELNAAVPMPESANKAQDAFKLGVLSSDATSVRLAWQPQPDVGEYEVLRDGSSAGRTTSVVGRFTDFGLSPRTSYVYRVIAHTGDGPGIASNLVVARTTRTQRIKTDYTVLAIAFEDIPVPTDALIDDLYLRHRIQFIELASQRSAKIHLYNGAIIRTRQRLAFDATIGTVDYANLVLRGDLAGMGGHSIIDLVENGDIDHVWVLRSPFAFLENALIGNRPIQGNGQTTINTWTPLQVPCSRSFFVNAYLPDERSYDAYAHMVEGIMTSISDGHPSTWPRNLTYTTYTPDRASYTTQVNMLNEFERFRLADEWNGTSPVAYASPGNGNAGSSHFPPNSSRDCADYCYYNLATWRRYIDSSADDWLRYPDGFGEKRKLNGYDFGAFNHYAEGDASYAPMLLRSPENHSSFQISPASFHQWWFAHLPHNPGVSDGRLNNWWPYLFDFNRFDGSAITYNVTGFDGGKHRFKPQQGEYGTDVAASGEWGYWHSLNGFSPGAKVAQISVVNRRDSSNDVVSGQRAIHVVIDGAQYWDFLGVGRNDLFYPMSKNAHWNLLGLSRVQFAVKPEINASLITGTNPIVRIYTNSGNRIELVPRSSGRYVNLFAGGSVLSADGWYNFDIPMVGGAAWEKNVIGYVNPLLSDSELQTARAALEREILSDVNYVEISIRSVIPAPVVAHEIVSYYVDNLRLISR